MIIGTGIDIIEIDRIAKAIGRAHFVERVFSQRERAYCDARGAQRAASYAARFAGKEAVLKAFGTGLVAGALPEIEILPDPLGCPKIFLSGYFAKQAEALVVNDIQVSLSHARSYAVAQVLFWRD